MERERVKSSDLLVEPMNFIIFWLENFSKLSRGLVKHNIKENSVSVLYIGMKEHSCKK